MKALSIITLVLLVISCAPIHVNYDFEKGTDFSKYKTYNYYSNIKTGLSDLDTKRILESIDNKLETMGIIFSENPDFFIDIKSSAYHETQQSTVGVGLGGSGRNVGGGISIGIPVGQTRMNRQITIDFVDEKAKRLFWQAVSKSGFNPNALPEKREENLNAIVEKVLSQYPPK